MKLDISDLHVEIDGKKILNGIDLHINKGEVHALMGPNGNGKSTLVQTIMGHPKYTVTKGSITFNGEDVLKMEVDERSKAGMFLAMQYPSEIPGVSGLDFLNTAVNARNEKPVSMYKFMVKLDDNIEGLKMNKELVYRHLNDGFSGGEKKRNEILQLRLLNPQFAMLDEIDSGLDVDAIKIVAENIQKQLEEEATSFLIVSHYERFFELVKPTHIHIILDGKIVTSGGYELVQKIDREGYDWINEK